MKWEVMELTTVVNDNCHDVVINAQVLLEGHEQRSYVLSSYGFY